MPNENDLGPILRVCKNHLNEEAYAMLVAALAEPQAAVTEWVRENDDAR